MTTLRTFLAVVSNHRALLCLVICLGFPQWSAQQPVLTDPDRYDIELFADFTGIPGAPKVFHMTITPGQNGFPAGLYVTSGPADDDRSDRLFRVNKDRVIEVVSGGFQSNEVMVFAEGAYGEGILITEPRAVRIRRLLADGTLSTFSETGTLPFGPAGLSWGPDGLLYTTDFTSGEILRVSPLGIAEQIGTVPLASDAMLTFSGAKALTLDVTGTYGGGFLAGTFSFAAENPEPHGLDKIYHVSPIQGLVSEVAVGFTGLEFLTPGPGGVFGTDLYIAEIGTDLYADGALYTLNPEGGVKVFLSGVDATHVIFDTKGVLGGGMFVADMCNTLNQSDHPEGRIWRITQKINPPYLENPGMYTVRLFKDLSSLTGNLKAFSLRISDGSAGLPRGLYMTSGPTADTRSDRIIRLDKEGEATIVLENLTSNEDLVFVSDPYPKGALISIPLEQRILLLRPDGTTETFTSGFTAPFGPSGLAILEDGYVYTCDNSGNTVYRILPNGTKQPFVQIPSEHTFGPKAIMPGCAGSGYALVGTFSVPEIHPPGSGTIWSVPFDGEFIVPVATGFDGMELLSCGPGFNFGAKTDIFIPTIGGAAQGDGALYVMNADAAMVPFMTGLDAVSVAFDTKDILGGGMFIADINDGGGAGRIWHVEPILKKTTPVLADTEHFEIGPLVDLSILGVPKAFGLAISDGTSGFTKGLYITGGPAPDVRANRMLRYTPDGLLEVVYEGFTSNFQMVFARGEFAPGILVTSPLDQRIYRLLPDGIRELFASGFAPPFGPSGLIYDAGGQLITLDQSNWNVLKVIPDGLHQIIASIPPDGSFGPSSIIADPQGRYGGEYVVSTFSASSVNPGMGGLYAVTSAGFEPIPLISGIDGLELLTFGPGGNFGYDLFVSTIGGEGTGDGGVYTLTPEGELIPFVTGIDATHVLFDTAGILDGGMYIADLVEQDQIEVIWYGAAMIWHVNTKSGVPVEESAKPAAYALHPCYPNPFHSRITIEVDIPIRGHCSLALYDLFGHKLKTITSGVFSAGRHQFEMDSSDLVDGLYFVQLHAGDFSDTQPVVFIQ